MATVPVRFQLLRMTLAHTLPPICLVQPRQRRDHLRNPSNDLRRLGRDLATRGGSLASRIYLSVSVGETAGDAERTPSNASASAGSRGMWGVDIGHSTFDVQNDVCGQGESWTNSTDSQSERWDG